LQYLAAPFPFHHVAEILRRDDLINLDAVRKPTAKKMGFGSWTANRAGAAPRTEAVYYVFPFLGTLDNLDRLCRILLLQTCPCLVSIGLRPYRLTEVDEAELEERIRRCEKYSQLTLLGDGGPEQVETFLRSQAAALYRHCAREYLQLQDAAFLLKVQVCAPQPFGAELPDMLGASITEHAGQPHPAFQDAVESSLVGGYHVCLPGNAEEEATALANLTNMSFIPWAEGTAPPGREHWRYLMDMGQAAAAFRLPLPITGEFPGVNTILYHPRSAPADLPEEGLLIGEHDFLSGCRQVYFPQRDRRRHVYAVGQTGTGKSTLFLRMLLQDIQAGRGVGLIDPHGELLEQVLAGIPRSRWAEVVYIDPQDYERPVGLNMLQYRTIFEKDFCVNYLIEIFDRLYDLRETGGPIFEMYMRNALQLLLDQPPPFQATILDVPRLFQDYSFRRKLLSRCTNRYVFNFWENEASCAERDLSLSNMAPYITSKLCRFVYNDLIRVIVGQPETTINFREVLDRGQILLVDLRKGILGETNSHFLGMILVGQVFTAALSRTEIGDKSVLQDFHLYVDEFHNLATPTFINILSEARKYRLAVTLTNQYIAQLPKFILDGILGNVGTLISFRVGPPDAELISQALGGAVTVKDLLGLSNWHTYVKLLSGGNVSAPFDMRTLLPPKYQEPEAAITIQQLSRMRYGRDREQVEAKILQAWQAEEFEADKNHPIRECHGEAIGKLRRIVAEAEETDPIREYARAELAKFNEEQLKDEDTDQQDEQFPDETEY
ncbi:MAG: type IV secretory system conjugative DNA transfer family protein, partial [Syntrophobacteria bacterium]